MRKWEIRQGGEKGERAQRRYELRPLGDAAEVSTYRTKIPADILLRIIASARVIYTHIT
jgi:hypothetical protein